MSITTTGPPPTMPPDPLWRLSVDQYHEMIRTGILTDEDPVELLDGCLVRQTPKYPLHSFVTQELRDWFARTLPPAYFVNAQEPVTLPTSEPEPDITIVRSQRQMFAARHPASADVPLLVEVSDSTLTRDRTSKKGIYASAGIVQYWIINLIDRQIEVCTEPHEATGDYRQRIVYLVQQEAPVIVDGKTIGTIRLEQLLPPEQ